MLTRQPEVPSTAKVRLTSACFLVRTAQVMWTQSSLGLGCVESTRVNVLMTYVCLTLNIFTFTSNYVLFFLHLSSPQCKILFSWLSLQLIVFSTPSEDPCQVQKSWYSEVSEKILPRWFLPELRISSFFLFSSCRLHWIAEWLIKFHRKISVFLWGQTDSRWPSQLLPLLRVSAFWMPPSLFFGSLW